MLSVFVVVVVVVVVVAIIGCACTTSYRILVPKNNYLLLTDVSFANFELFCPATHHRPPHNKLGVHVEASALIRGRCPGTGTLCKCHAWYDISSY